MIAVNIWEYLEIWKLEIKSPELEIAIAPNLKMRVQTCEMKWASRPRSRRKPFCRSPSCWPRWSSCRPAPSARRRSSSSISTAARATGYRSGTTRIRGHRRWRAPSSVWMNSRVTRKLANWKSAVTRMAKSASAKNWVLAPPRVHRLALSLMYSLCYLSFSRHVFFHHICFFGLGGVHNPNVGSMGYLPNRR